MGKTNDDAIAAILGIVFICGWIVFCIALVLLKLWVIGSLATSTLKTLKNDCGQRYGVESVLSGDWFCPSPKTSSSVDKPASVSGAY